MVKIAEYAPKLKEKNQRKMKNEFYYPFIQGLQIIKGLIP